MGEVVKTYYETGELKTQVFEINGKKNGEYISYHQNGELYILCSYVDDKKMVNIKYIGEMENYGKFVFI